ncbi:MAG: heavy metal translocating P-type ATPase [Lachnospiraceae bacterium]|nr:heavy metal translocating P-type ATPase [Lachnospiraceae bacterium]
MIKNEEMNPLQEHSHEDHDCCSHSHEGHEHSHEGHGCCGHSHEGHDHSHGGHEHSHEDHGCCGHSHGGHEHSHEDHGCCGHSHEGHDHSHGGHEHSHEDHGCCGHSHEDHGHSHGESSHDRLRTGSGKGTRVFILEGLDCPNCAQKIEDKVAGLPYVNSCVVTYQNLQMRVDSKESDLLTKIQSAIDEVEEGITVVERKRSAGGQTTVYILQGLDCPNCAQKIEDKLNSLSEIDEAVVTYANTQVRITAKGSAGMTEFLQKEIDQVEDGITVIKKENVKKAETADAALKTGMDPMKKSMMEIIIGAAIFIIPFTATHFFGVEGLSWASALFVAAYVILGGKVLSTAWSNVKRGQFFDENFLMAIATLGAFVLGIYNKSFEFDEGVGVMLFYRIGEYFEQKATVRSRSQIMDAVDMRPEVVNLVSGEEIRVVDAEEAEVGDVLLVRPGDRIPLDGVVVEGESRIDTSPVTGEPVPVKAGVGDSVVSGCVNTNGVLRIRVEKVLEESLVTRILDSVENAAASKPKIDKFITKFSKIYTPFVIFFAVAVAVIPSLAAALGGYEVPFIAARLAEGHAVSDYVQYWVTTALTFLVISCPCALVLSVPLAFFSGIGAGSKKGILFKGGIAIESLTNLKAVVMDKTGTITEGNFVVQRTVPTSSSSFSEKDLLAMAASCELSSTHPIGISIVNAAENAGLKMERPADMEEIAGKGIRAIVNGKTVLTGNRRLMEQFGIDLSAYKKEGFGTEVLVAVDGLYAGSIIISDTIKTEAADAIRRTKNYGIVTAMLTGDAQDSAQAVAEKTGIDEVYAKLMPQDKLDRLMQIREKHGNVMFVGDGINDAPVLAGADVGAAMGSGADAAIEAADVVFMTSSMDAIPQAIDIARATSAISWQNVYFALAVKVVVMAMGLFGYANMWLAVFADTGVSMLCLLNSMRILYRK